MEDLKTALLALLNKYTREEIFSRGIKHQSLDNGKTYTSFLPFLQSELPFFAKANAIVMALQHLLENEETPLSIKEKIEMIFAIMDPRDQNYRYDTDCHCRICEFGKQPLSSQLILLFPPNLN